MSWFKKKVPRNYALNLIRLLGKPTGQGENFVTWINKSKRSPYVRIIVMDEYIRHTFPKAHFDFVYTTAKMPGINAEIACKLIKVINA